MNLLRSQTLRALRDYLKDRNISYRYCFSVANSTKVSFLIYSFISSQFGALSALMALGPEVLEECLLPQMEQYLNILSDKLLRVEGRRMGLEMERKKTVSDVRHPCSDPLIV